MALQGSLQFPAVSPGSAAIPPSGYYTFFVADGTSGTTNGAYYKKDSSGTVSPLIPIAYTDEQAQDAVGSILVDSTSIDFTYDDSGNSITAVVVPEAIQDIVGAFLSAADSTITVAYNDVANTLTVGVNSITSAKVSDFTEAAQDAVGGALVDSTSIDFTYNDGANTITADVVTEAIQDIVGALISAVDGTISVTYNDGAGTLTIGVGTITSAKVSDFTEAAQDAVGAMLVDSADIDVTYNDAGNTESISVGAYTGDVTKASGGTSLTIGNDAVTNAKLANMPAMTIKGNNTGSSADPADLTLAQVEQILNFGITTRSTTASVAISNATTEQVLAAFTVPANTLAVGDVIHLHSNISGTRNTTAMSITPRVRVGAVGSGISGAVAAQAGPMLTIAGAVATTGQIDAYLTVRSVGAAGTIIGDVTVSLPIVTGTTTASAAVTTPVAIDTTQDRAFTLTVQLSAAQLTGGTSTLAFIEHVA